MARQQASAVLDTRTALHRAFQQVAQLRRHRQQPARSGKLDRQPCETMQDETQDQRRQHAAAQPRPGLGRAYPWRQLRAADRTPREISANVGRPHQRQCPEGEQKPARLLLTQKDKRHHRHENVEYPQRKTGRSRDKHDKEESRNRKRKGCPR